MISLVLLISFILVMALVFLYTVWLDEILLSPYFFAFAPLEWQYYVRWGSMRLTCRESFSKDEFFYVFEQEGENGKGYINEYLMDGITQKHMDALAPRARKMGVVLFGEKQYIRRVVHMAPDGTLGLIRDPAKLTGKEVFLHIAPGSGTITRLRDPVML